MAKGRDPSAPKRNMSTYLLYQNAMREEFKSLNPGMTFGQLAKYTSAMYSELPPSEKEAWVQRAEADKARYLHELANYVPPAGYDAKGDAIQTPLQRAGAQHHGGVIQRKRKPEKDANAPKRNMSAYLLYQNAMRDQFKRENPGMTFGQLAKFTSHMYRNLTPEEKAAWQGRASQDKARYDAEMAAYNPPPGHDARGALIEQEGRPRKRSKRSPRDPAAPKRASGAYVFFTNYMRPRINEEFPGIKFVELGKLLGERWRSLSPAQKKQYEEMAAEDKVRFQIEMQQYTANQAATGGGGSPPQQHIPHTSRRETASPAEPAPPPAVDHHSAAASYYDQNVGHHQPLHSQQEYAQVYHHDPYGHIQYHAA